MPKELSPYPAYRDSGVLWLGEIPAHWSASQVNGALKSNLARCSGAGFIFVGCEDTLSQGPPHAVVLGANREFAGDVGIA